MDKTIDLSGHRMVFSMDGGFGKFRTLEGGSDEDATGGTLVNATEARALSKAFAEMADELSNGKDTEAEEIVLDGVESDSGIYVSFNFHGPVLDTRAAKDLVVKAIKEAKKKGRQ